MMVDNIYGLKEKVLREKKIAEELNNFFNTMKSVNNPDEIAKISMQIDSLKNFLKKTNDEIPEILKDLSVKASLKKAMPAPLPHKKIIKERPKDHTETINSNIKTKGENLDDELDWLERKTIKRLKKQKKSTKKKKVKKANGYVKISNKFFSQASFKLTKSPMFEPLKRDLIKANLQFPHVSYISVILFTTFLSFFAGIFLFFFFLFFNIGALFPFITLMEEEILKRFTEVFWIPLVLPILTFASMYFYPALERKSAKNKINVELPFATIHMSAISGSMIDPTKIFEILVSTKEYPAISKEFIKLINEINIYGYDLVSALKNTAINSPSKRLADLLNGLATTITSGGNLPDFFDKRSSTLLFDYRMQKEREIRSSETFMDIYISLVIAAPMILMLLLMMMKISGLGIQLSTNMIALVMVLGVSFLNIAFLMFLMLKQSSGGGS